MEETLFHFGPFNVNILNIFMVSGIYIAAFIVKRFIMQSVFGYIKSSKITIENRQMSYIKLTGQSIYLLALYLSVQSFRVNNPDITFEDFLNYKLIDADYFKISFFNIFGILLVFFCTKIALNILKILIGDRLKRTKNYSVAKEFVYVQLTKYILYTLAIIISLRILHVNVNFLITGSAALLVGIGLGLQDVFKDFISGIVLLFEGNVKVGDIVELNAGTNTSSTLSSDYMAVKILKINIRTTEIQTRDGNTLVIPNSKLTGDVIENWSQGERGTRFRIQITVAYGTNTDLVIHLLRHAAESHPKVSNYREIMVRLANFGDNGLEFELIFWAEQSWNINNYRSEIRLEINRLFQENNIEIPFPKRSIQFMNKPND